MNIAWETHCMNQAYWHFKTQHLNRVCENSTRTHYSGTAKLKFTTFYFDGSICAVWLIGTTICWESDIKTIDYSRPLAPNQIVVEWGVSATDWYFVNEIGTFVYMSMSTLKQGWFLLHNGRYPFFKSTHLPSSIPNLYFWGIGTTVCCKSDSKIIDWASKWSMVECEGILFSDTDWNEIGTLVYVHHQAWMIAILPC